MSKFESPVSPDLHVFAKWEETGAAKGNTVNTRGTPQKGNITILCALGDIFADVLKMTFMNFMASTSF